MTLDFASWENGAVVIPAGDAEFSSWENGAPMIDLGAGNDADVVLRRRVIMF